MQDIAKDKTRSQQDDSGLQPELVCSNAGAKDARQPDRIGDDDADQDRPQDVLHVGQDQVVRLAVARNGLLDKLARIAHDEEQSDAGQQAGKAMFVGVIAIALERQGKRGAGGHGVSLPGNGTDDVGANKERERKRKNNGPDIEREREFPGGGRHGALLWGWGAARLWERVGIDEL